MSYYPLISLMPKTVDDAQAFITAAGITDPTQQSAIITLVADLKGYSIWTKFKAIYPIVGGIASSHAVNLKTPGTFNLTYAVGVTHSSTGMIGNGTSRYANTQLTPSTLPLTLNSTHYGYYSRTDKLRTILERPWEEVQTQCPISFAPGQFNEFGFPPGIDPNSWSFFHSVIIGYRPTERCIIGFVQIYNMPYIALIDGNYQGEAGCKGYYVNPLTGDDKIVEENQSIPITRENLEENIENWLTSDTITLFRQRLAQNNTTAIYINDIERTFQEAGRRVGLNEGEPLNEAFIAQFVNLIENTSLVMNHVYAITFPNRVFEVLVDLSEKDPKPQWFNLSQIQNGLQKIGFTSSFELIEIAIDILKEEPDRIGCLFELEQRVNNGILEVKLNPREKKS
jgi:hypothetical protein